MIQNTFCEHIVKQKCQGKFLVYRILLLALYAALIILPSFAIMILAPTNLLVPLMLIIATIVFVVFKLTWKLTCLEYEYQIVEDSIIFSKIYGKKRRKAIIEMPIRAFSILGKYSPESEKYLSKLLVDKNFLFISSFSAENIFFGVFEADEKKCIIFFEAEANAEVRLQRYGYMAFRAYERELRQI